MRSIMKRSFKSLALTILTFYLLLPFTEAQAGIHGTLYVNNSRSSAISICVEKADGTVSYYNIAARSSKSITVNDAAEGTTWLYAYEGESLIKSTGASGSYTSYTWWVD